MAPETDGKGVGLLRGLSFEDYFRIDAANHSTLRLFNRSPAHARQEMLTPREPTKALDTGHAVHVAMLEPDRFEMEFVQALDLPRRSNKDKEAHAQFARQHSNKTIISRDDMELCYRLRDAVWSHPVAGAMLKGDGINEATLVWPDEATGELCKGRVDRLTEFMGWPFIVDLKTTKNGSLGPWQKDVHYYSYHQQAAFYIDGAAALAPADRRWAWICVEKEPPFAVVCYEIDEASLEQGREEYRQHLETFAACKKEGRWPGYPEELDYAGLPAWAFKGY